MAIRPMRDPITPRRPPWLGGLMAISVVLAIGCSSGQGGRADLRGRVTLDGEPLELGSITLEPIGGGQVTGGLVRAGRYEITGKAAAKAGHYRVSIVASPTLTGRMIQDESKPPGSLSPEMLGGIVAERFNAATTLRIEVVPGDNVTDFAVESR